MIQKKYIIATVAILVATMIVSFGFAIYSSSGGSIKKTQTETEGYVTQVLNIEPFSDELYNSLTSKEYDALKSQVFDYLVEAGEKSPSISIQSVNRDNTSQAITINATSKNTNKPLVIKITYTETLVLISINDYKGRLL